LGGEPPKDRVEVCPFFVPELLFEVSRMKHATLAQSAGATVTGGVEPHERVEGAPLMHEKKLVAGGVPRLEIGSDGSAGKVWKKGVLHGILLFVCVARDG
jgi:hypothetical protein